MAIIDSPVHVYEANTPTRPWHTAPNIVSVEEVVTDTSIDVLLGHRDNAWSFDHSDTLTIAVTDAPRPDEIVVVVAVADGGRPHPRVGKGRAVV